MIRVCREYHFSPPEFVAHKWDCDPISCRSVENGMVATQYQRYPSLGFAEADLAYKGMQLVIAPCLKEGADDADGRG